MSADVESTFVSCLAPELASTLRMSETIVLRLRSLVSEVAAEFGLTEAMAAEAIAARLTPEDVAEPLEALESFVAADLGLALACALGDPRALATFDLRFGGDMDRALRKSSNLHVTKDEFRQVIREKLFVAAPGAAPKIASYSGRAALGAWVRVTCARAVIDLVRKTKDADVISDESLIERLPAHENPEHAAIRARYADLLPTAFGSALRSLTPRQRNLLRQRYLHGVPAAALAQTYGVHRATLFSWIEDARSDLLRFTQNHLRPMVQGESLDSVMGIMGSELDLSIRRLLDSAVEREEPPR